MFLDFEVEASAFRGHGSGGLCIHIGAVDLDYVLSMGLLAVQGFLRREGLLEPWGIWGMIGTL